MKKFLLQVVFLTSTSFIVSFFIPALSHAAEPNEICNLNPDNCRTGFAGPDGKIRHYKCQIPFSVGGDDYPRCIEQPTAGIDACPKRGEQCNALNSDTRGCCAFDADGKTPLACDAKDNTCKLQTEIQCDPSDPGCYSCAKESQACGGGNGVTSPQCCQEVRGAQTLTCVSATNQPIASTEQGTCKFIDKSLPTIPPPPPPPCAHPIGADGKCNQFATAIGQLGTVPEQFITSLFAALLSISGGIALLLIIKAGYQMLVSQGKPESINNARDQLVAAIVGLIFLIFSFVILQVIGFDILQIPGFGGA